MKNTQGAWVGWGLGDVGPKVADIQKFLARRYAKTAGSLVATGTYDQATADVVAKLQRNLIANGKYKGAANGVLNYDTQVALGYVKAAPVPAPKVIGFSVEGHMSDMWRGPVADTFTILANEHRLHHQPTGYENGSIPFNNASGTNELARFYRSERLDDGTPFPRGTKSVLGDFSQGGIVVTDFVINYLLPGCELDWRTPDILGRLSYGNPTRNAGSVAPWSRAQAGPAQNTGLDPLIRFDKLGLVSPFPQMDVYRKGDIFSDNEPTAEGEIKAAIYQFVARGDIFSNPTSVVAQIADAFKVPLDYVWAAFEAIISGLGFLVKQGDNPHYSPYNLDGGLNWLRGLLP